MAADPDASPAQEPTSTTTEDGGTVGVPGTRSGLSVVQVVVLVAAVAFLVGAIAYVVGDGRGSADPLNAVDVGFMQDMSYHHDQAVEMSMMLLGKDDVDPALQAFAYEIIISQKYEQGVFAAILDRFGHDVDPSDVAMEWMGTGVPTEEMEGLATPAQLEALREADGAEAEALWIALMSEHHLAGLHMADYAARHGQDETVVNQARGMVKNQRGEVIDIQRFRTSNDLPIPEGFTDPLEDQRLNPISFGSNDD